MIKKSAIIIFGPPNSGKGTQAKLLAEKLGFFHFMTSPIFKHYMQTRDDPETIRQKELYAKGILLDPSWVLQIVKEKTQEVFDQDKGIVYDGASRTLYEAEGLYPFLVDLFGKENIKIVEIKVDEEERRKRSAKRLICEKDSSHVFILSEELQPKTPCPEGDGVLQKRDLDDESLFRTRMDEYNERTMPGLDFLKNKHPVIEVNGEQSILKVHQDILLALKLT